MAARSARDREASETRRSEPLWSPAVWIFGRGKRVEFQELKRDDICLGSYRRSALKWDFSKWSLKVGRGRGRVCLLHSTMLEFCSFSPSKGNSTIFDLKLGSRYIYIYIGARNKGIRNRRGWVKRIIGNRFPLISIGASSINHRRKSNQLTTNSPSAPKPLTTVAAIRSCICIG